MTKIAVLPEYTGTDVVTYRAVAGERQSVGRTVGEALDALTRQLPEEESSTLIIVQSRRPDAFFDAEQQRRLGDLMGRWREARDAGRSLPAAEQAELQSLVESEACGATERAAALLLELTR